MRFAVVVTVSPPNLPGGRSEQFAHHSSNEAMFARLKPYLRMKDSGVEWLGEVPEHWEIYRAKWLFLKKSRPVRNSDEVVTCFRDGTVTKRKNRRAVGFTESLKEIGYQGIRRGDLVIHTMDAFAGAIGVADSDGKSTPMYSVCRPRSLADSWYYAHIVREMARNQWILALAKGIRERSTDFRFADFSSQLVPLPPFPEQHAIVRFLDHATGRIERQIRAKEKLIALLKEQKQVVVNDAVTGRIDVRTGQPYPEYKDSGVEWLGEVPGHWEVVPLKRTGWFCSGAGFPVSFQGNLGGEILYAKVSDTNRPGNRRKMISTANSVSREVARKLGAHIFPPDTIIFPKVGGALLTNKRRILVRETCIDNNLMGCVVTSAHTEFMFRLLSNLDLGKISKPGPVPAISEGEVREIRISLPPFSEQTAIARYLDDAIANTSSAIDRARREIELLREYRTRLVADVVTGKLDVREAAADLPETAAPVGSGDLDAVFSDFEARDVGLRRDDNLTRDELYDEAINGDPAGIR